MGFRPLMSPANLIRKFGVRPLKWLVEGGLQPNARLRGLSILVRLLLGKELLAD